MGAWGTGPFDNDAAGDVLDEISAASRADRQGLIEGKLSKVSDATGRLDSWETDQALAVAALVAASTGAGEALHRDAIEFLSDHPLESGPELRAQALRTIDRALVANANEWHDLWVRSGGLDEAMRSLAPFRDALHRSLAG